MHIYIYIYIYIYYNAKLFKQIITATKHVNYYLTMIYMNVNFLMMVKV